MAVLCVSVGDPSQAGVTGLKDWLHVLSRLGLFIHYCEGVLVPGIVIGLVAFAILLPITFLWLMRCGGYLVQIVCHFV